MWKWRHACYLGPRTQCEPLPGAGSRRGRPMRRAAIGNHLRGGRAWALAIACAWAFAAAPPASGQEVPGGDPPDAPAAFLLETITVEGTRHASPELILAESLLRAGQSYTETALRQGVYRVRRLPFVRAARFALRKGSARGSYELVITVEETHRVFFGAETSLAKGAEWQLGGVGTVGGRVFVGAHGVAFAAVRGAQARVGYTHYNLFNRRAFASLEIGRTDDCCGGLTYDHVFGGPNFDSVPTDTDSAELTLGFPVARNQTVQLSLLADQTDGFGRALSISGQGEVLEVRFPVDARQRRAELRWVLDTSDDPVVPSRGTVVTALVGAAESKRDARFFRPGSQPPAEQSVRFEDEFVNASISARHFWPLSVRQSLSLAATLSTTRSSNENEICCFPAESRFSGDVTSEGSVLDLGYAASLWSEEQTRRRGDFRFEARVSPAVVARDGFEDAIFFAHLDAGLIFRNAWGIFRFRVFYQLVEG